MGIRISSSSKAKASLRLLSHISTYMFEEEYGEMKGNPKIRKVLDEARKTLSEIIGNN